ncbi:MAG: hypothetical protein R3F20_11210 [Planctomycetota bacterium]
MIETNSSGLRRQRGMSLVETMGVCIITAGMMVFLAKTTVLYSDQTTSSIHRDAALKEARAILDVASRELCQTTSQRDHEEPAGLTLPLPSDTDPDTLNEAYNYPPVSVGLLHETRDRDGTEYWHADTTTRRFFIYATYEAFDTIEYSRVAMPQGAEDAAAFLAGAAGELEIPWTRPKKILRVGDQVVLRSLRSEDPNDFEETVLGTGVTRLEFHLDAEGRFEILVETRSGEETEQGMGDANGARASESLVVNPFNTL